MKMMAQQFSMQSNIARKMIKNTLPELNEKINKKNPEDLNTND